MRLALKMAILEIGTQRQIAMVAEIPETCLSAIVRGRATATADERARLATAIGRPEAVLFPDVHEQLATAV